MPADAIINVNGDSLQALDITLLLVVVTLLPTLVVMMTSFTRYVISFSFLRTAMGTQQTPPNMVLVGVALFLTLFTMGPVIDQVNQVAYQPYVNEEIGQDEFFELAQQPLKEFMLRNTEPSSLNMYCDLAQLDRPDHSPAKQAALAQELVEKFIETAPTNRELLVSLIQRVELAADKQIIIQFRFRQLEADF